MKLADLVETFETCEICGRKSPMIMHVSKTDLRLSCAACALELAESRSFYKMFSGKPLKRKKKTRGKK